MNIVISGYGRMGKEVEAAATAKGHKIAYIIDSEQDWDKLAEIAPACDVIIDFSTPDTALENIRNGFDLGLPIVIGTTGWYKDLDMVKRWVINEGKALFVASNFSIGVNILFELSRKLGTFMARLENYDITIEEIHHTHKIDAPSGTAIKLAEIILGTVGRKKKWVNEQSEDPEVLPVISKREGEVTGTHVISCESQNDILELKHSAKNRKGFAQGAILAAEWIAGKTGFYEMKDLLNLGND